MDSLAQLLALIHKVHHKLDHIGDPVRKLRGRGIYNRFILRTVVHLLTEIGVFDLGDVSFPTENALSFIHQGSQLILKTECFFQILFLKYMFYPNRVCLQVALDSSRI